MGWSVVLIVSVRDSSQATVTVGLVNGSPHHTMGGDTMGFHVGA